LCLAPVLIGGARVELSETIRLLFYEVAGDAWDASDRLPPAIISPIGMCLIKCPGSWGGPDGRSLEKVGDPCICQRRGTF